MKKPKQPELPQPNKAPAVAIPQAPLAPWVRHFISGVFLFGGVLILWALLQMGAVGEDTARLKAEGWGSYAAAIAGNRSIALWHAALMTMATGILLLVLVSRRARTGALRRLAASLLVLIVAGDALWLSRHYIKTMPVSLLEENDVIRILKSVAPEQRSALMSQEGFYNFWLTYLFPYHHLPVMNVTQMPRMPVDYQRYLGALAPRPVTFWQLAAVRYVLAPAQAWMQIQNDPIMKEALDIVYAYNVAPTGIGVRVVPASVSQPGLHTVLHLKKPAPRFALIAAWQQVADDEALQQMASTNFVPFQKVLCPAESVAGLPELSGTGMVGQVQMTEYTPGYRKLKVSTDQPAILRISEKYDHAWRAWIDKQSVPVRRVDFIFQGVFVPAAGLHEVVLKYAPDMRPLLWEWSGILICMAAGVTLIVKAQKRP